MKITLSTLLDTLFSFVITFLLSFVLLSAFIGRQFSIAFSLVFALLFAMIVFKKLSSKNFSSFANSKDKKQAEYMSTGLSLCDYNAQCKHLIKGVKENLDAKIIKDGIYIKDEKIAIFPLFKFEPVTKTDVVKIFNKTHKDYSAYILSQSFSMEILAFIDRFNGKILAIKEDQVYKHLKNNDALPSFDLPFKSSKNNVVTAFKKSLNKKRAKTYFLFGAIFLSMSYFVPIKLYYIICGCIFLLLSLFCILFGEKQVKE